MNVFKMVVNAILGGKKQCAKPAKPALAHESIVKSGRGTQGKTGRIVFTGRTVNRHTCDLFTATDLAAKDLNELAGNLVKSYHANLRAHRGTAAGHAALFLEAHNAGVPVARVRLVQCSTTEQGGGKNFNIKADRLEKELVKLGV